MLRPTSPAEQTIKSCSKAIESIKIGNFFILPNPYRIICTVNITCRFLQVFLRNHAYFFIARNFGQFFSDKCSVSGRIPMTGPVLSPISARVL